MAPIGKPKRRIRVEPLPEPLRREVPSPPREAPPVREPVAPAEPRRERVPA
jgi:hypothetical protein